MVRMQLDTHTHTTCMYSTITGMHVFGIILHFNSRGLIFGRACVYRYRLHPDVSDGTIIFIDKWISFYCCLFCKGPLVVTGTSIAAANTMLSQRLLR